MKSNHATTALILGVTAIAVLVPAGVAVAQWQQNGSDVYYSAGKVGIGASSLSAALTSVPGGIAGGAAEGIWVTSPWGAQALHAYGVGGGISVNAEATGTGTGLFAHSELGTALYANATSSSGLTYAIQLQNNSPDGYGIYAVSGKSVFWDPVSIGSDPAYAKLHVAGSLDGMVFNANSQFYVNQTNDFVGVGRSAPITPNEVFGIRRNTGDFVGMYVDSGVNGKPFYGYANSGNYQAYHYYEGLSDQWRLYVHGDRIAVGNNGNVGIGTISPSFLLHVNGTAGKPGGGSWSVASDLRLKKNVLGLEGSLEKMLELRGVSFEYSDPESIGELPGKRIGMVAQEVEAVFPDWVDASPDGYKRLTFRGFEALTVEALRELREEKNIEVDELREECAALRTRLAEREDEASKLEKRVEALEAVLARATKSLDAASPSAPGKLKS